MGPFGTGILAIACGNSAALPTHATRHLPRQRKILFLDEGTANLDEKTEETIADLIAQMPITRIIVAHRPALIRRAKHVFYVEGRSIRAVKLPAPPSEAPKEAAQ